MIPSRSLLPILSLALVGAEAMSPTQMRVRQAQVAAQFPAMIPGPLAGEGTGAKAQKNLIFGPAASGTIL